MMMLKHVGEQWPIISDDEIQARCREIQKKWSGREKRKRKIDSERRIRVLDRTLRCGSITPFSPRAANSALISRQLAVAPAK